jgi:hypothetical protein
LDQINKTGRRSQVAKRFYVDVPDPATIGPETEVYFQNVANFPTKEAAVQWIRENIDPQADEEGQICLITEGGDD